MGDLQRRDTPCERCGWRYVGYHVCFDASNPCPGEGVVSATKKVKKSKKDSSYSVRPKRRTLTHEEKKEQTKLIVELYKSGLSLTDIGKKYDISYGQVNKVITRYEATSGEKIMRPRGRNNRWSQKEVVGGFN